MALPASGKIVLFGCFEKIQVDRHPGEARGPSRSGRDWNNRAPGFHREPWIPAWPGMTHLMVSQKARRVWWGHAGRARYRARSSADGGTPLQLNHRFVDFFRNHHFYGEKTWKMFPHT
jgi:hypothetical protein